MFKIKSKTPSVQDNVEIIADYIEVKCLISENKSVSIRRIIHSLLRSSDTFETSGIEDFDDTIISKTELISSEFQRRINSSNSRYPFNILHHGEVLEFKGLENLHSLIYTYLLFATRLNMTENKKFDNIDGTGILEKISSYVAANYFGSRSTHLILGTSVKGGFEKKVNNLCKKLGEGIKFVNRSKGSIDENDDKVDIVVWIDFSDKRVSKFIGFGQCKTGTNWENDRFQLQPIEFCKKWLHSQPVVDPIRMFFLADIVEDEIWHKRAVDAGLLFDRLRILDHFPTSGIPAVLLKEITSWTTHAINFTQKNLN
ncbi:MAG: hypothetical protein J0L56_03155 [Chitinophagales bacterium]|nr:hypothetical protein [Chitinophagales bacterium]